MNNMKSQKDMIPEDEPPHPPGLKVSNKLLQKHQGQLLIAPETTKQLDQSGNNTQLWIWLVVKSNGIKNNTA